MKILVTGGAGFIGSHLCEKLLKLGHYVICFDNMSTGSPDNINDAYKYKDRFVFIKGNANKYEDLKKTFDTYNPEAAYHYAAVAGVRRTMENPLSVLQDIKGIRNILELSVNNNLRKFIFASSSEVYGEPGKKSSSEKDPLNPKATYAAVKVIGEKFCSAYSKKYKLNTCCFRYFNIYGPRQESSDYGFVVGIFIERAIRNKEIQMFGNGNQTRDFTYIEDAVNASVNILKRDFSGGEIINIGTGLRTRISRISEKIIAEAGSKSKVVLLPKREGDIQHRCADIKKMKKILEYEPRYNISRGLKNSVEWYLKNLEKPVIYKTHFTK